MPELPEVFTTVKFLNKLASKHTIIDVWSSYNSAAKNGRGTIKDLAYFKYFKKAVVGARIAFVEQHGKNILLHLSNKKIIWVHMKMTGHFLYGTYKYIRKNGAQYWEAEDKGPLQDSFNKFIRLVFVLDNGKHLVLSDMRKFAKVLLFPEGKARNFEGELGPNPLNKNFTESGLREQLLRRPHSPIKQVLMDQTLLAGIGNIYSDEILWASNIHPQSNPGKFSADHFKKLFNSIQQILKEGIARGGDSMSDYRNPLGEKGSFQNFHKAYRRTGQHCPKKGCSGIIKRIVIGGRSTHFCPVHQKLI